MGYFFLSIYCHAHFHHVLCLLISAGFCEHKTIIEILLSHGADPSIKDNDGNTPQDSCENAQLKQLLQPSWYGQKYLDYFNFNVIPQFYTIQYNF